MTSLPMANPDEDTAVSLWIHFRCRFSSSPLMRPSAMRPLIAHRPSLYVSSLLCGRIIDKDVNPLYPVEEGKGNSGTKDEGTQDDGEEVEHMILVLPFRSRNAYNTFVDSPQYRELVDEKNLEGGTVSEVRLVDWHHLRYYSRALVSTSSSSSPSSSRVELLTAFLPRVEEDEEGKDNNKSEGGLSSEMKRKVDEEVIELRPQGGVVVNWSNTTRDTKDGTADIPADHGRQYASPLRRAAGRGWVERCTRPEEQQQGEVAGGVMWILPWNGEEGERSFKEEYTVSGRGGELVIDAFYRQLGELGAVRVESTHVEFDKVQIPLE